MGARAVAVKRTRDNDLDIRGLIDAGLEGAEWHVDEDADELDVVLPGAAGREGRMFLIDEEPERELYVRIDVETGQPLGLLVPNWSRWQTGDRGGKNGRGLVRARKLPALRYGVAEVRQRVRLSRQIAELARA
jgi:hypothetical protein